MEVLRTAGAPDARAEPERDAAPERPSAPQDEPVAAVGQRGPRRRRGAHAPLVAQLIATALGLAQTRARRRATIAEAAALYRRGAARDEEEDGSHGSA